MISPEVSAPPRANTVRRGKTFLSDESGRSRTLRTGNALCSSTRAISNCLRRVQNASSVLRTSRSSLACSSCSWGELPILMFLSRNSLSVSSAVSSSFLVQESCASINSLVAPACEVSVATMKFCRKPNRLSLRVEATCGSLARHRTVNIPVRRSRSASTIFRRSSAAFSWRRVSFELGLTRSMSNT